MRYLQVTYTYNGKIRYKIMSFCGLDRYSPTLVLRRLAIIHNTTDKEISIIEINEQ